MADPIVINAIDDLQTINAIYNSIDSKVYNAEHRKVIKKSFKKFRNFSIILVLFITIFVLIGTSLFIVKFNEFNDYTKYNYSETYLWFVENSEKKIIYLSEDTLKNNISISTEFVVGNFDDLGNLIEITDYTVFSDSMNREIILMLIITILVPIIFVIVLIFITRKTRFKEWYNYCLWYKSATVELMCDTYIDDNSNFIIKNILPKRKHSKLEVTIFIILIIIAISIFIICI